MADTMTLEELRESLDVGCLPNTDRPRWFAAIDAAIKQREQGAKDAAKYRELLMAVSNKFPYESRHETALRYIRERENQPCVPKYDAEMAKGAGNG